MTYIEDFDSKKIENYINDHKTHKIIDKNNAIYLIKNKLLHCDFGPAIIRDNGGYKEWWVNGKLHRTDGPAKYGSLVNGCTQTNIEEWYQNGERHRDDGPAIIKDELFELGNISNGYEKEEWWLNGKLHNLNGKAVKYLKFNIYRNRKIYRKKKFEWRINGKLHRDEKPALIKLKSNISGEFNVEKYWYQHDVLHRDKEPAVITKFLLGANRLFFYNICEKWYQNGKIHRLNKPAIINGKINLFYHFDKLHRLDGPAVSVDINLGIEPREFLVFLNVCLSNNIKYVEGETEYYFLYGNRYNKEIYEKIAKKIRDSEKKIVNKYARVWYEKCDQPGKYIWDININKALNGINKMGMIDG